MPVRKFRSVEEMEGPHFPPGVYRHRSIEAMNAHQEEWDAANFAAHRARVPRGDCVPTD
jgi:hypothetical protein